MRVAILGEQWSVEIDASITKETPRCSLTSIGNEIERMHQHTLVGAVGGLDQRAGRVGDERRAVEGRRALGDARRRWRPLDADTIRCHDWHEVRGAVALHDARPVALRVERRVLRLGADRCRIQQHVGALERHDARRLGEPLVPADADTHGTERRLEHLEARVADREVELLLIAGPVGNVRLAVQPAHRAVGVDHGHRVVVHVVGLLKERERQHDVQLSRQRHKVSQRRIVLGPRVQRRLKVRRRLVLAKVLVEEQLGQQHDVGAMLARRCLPHQSLGRRNVGLERLGACHLDGSHANLLVAHDRMVACFEGRGVCVPACSSSERMKQQGECA